MIAITYGRYGTPDVLALNEVTTPAPKPGEVLVRIRAAAATPTGCAFRAGKPIVTRLFMGMRRPKAPILGSDFAGEIAAIGDGVSALQIGDTVYGTTAPGSGAYAQYLTLPATGAIVPKPANLTFAEAAGLSDGVLTALPFLRDKAKLRPGQTILINGASGSIGTMAVQLAKHYGAHVTAVCSGANADLVRSLGADSVIDYTSEDFTAGRNAYDVVFDAVGKSSFGRCRRILKPRGRYLTTVPSMTGMLAVLWTSIRGGRRAIFAATGLRAAADKARDLEFVRGLAEAGIVRPITDRSYLLAEMAEAHRYVETGHKRGSVTVTMPAADKLAFPQIAG